jgi:hypothetical protein
MSFEYYFDKVLNFYNVSTIKELAEAINTGASTISNWKQRNSVTALKKKCRELGIYNKIFVLNNKEIVDYENLSEHDNYYIQQQKEVEKQISNRHLLTFKEISGMNATIVSSFVNVYKKFAEEGNLKELHKILGELEFD